jgi:imidazolonepropionase-like amidohydrolase
MSLLVVALIAPAIAQNAGKQVTAFVNVNVIPMDGERVLKDQTVVVRDGRIAELGPANKVKVPAGAASVDGRGGAPIRRIAVPAIIFISRMAWFVAQMSDK